MRPQDLAARLGGNELLVLLQAPATSVVPACERVTSHIQADPTAFGSGLSYSIGVVQLHADESMAAAVTQDHQAMLAATRWKKGGLAWLYQACEARPLTRLFGERAR